MRFLFRQTLLCLGFGGMMLTSMPAQAFCFDEAGARYKVDPLLIRAITYVESRNNPKAMNFNRNKAGGILSSDSGLMQINSTQIPGLLKMGVLENEKDLLTNPCLNVHIGTWILAKHLQQCGVNWECLGSYNAGFAKNNTARRMIYARKVYTAYLKLLDGVAL
ncbi:lytic transglycosylase [Enterobacterales bacterium CwR94]|nr:lytic transglycosylase [Enterobacterales bacterium CwR94]